MITIRTAGTNDIDTIHSLAHRIWRTAYKEMISAEQIVYMLNLMYSNASLEDQIEKQKHSFIIAYDDSTPIGFAAFYPTQDIIPITYRLDKLYVRPDQHGKGIGNKLLDHIISEIKPLGAEQLELTVNRRNKALTFYQKLGFVIVKEINIDIGEGFIMDDYLMALAL